MLTGRNLTVSHKDKTLEERPVGECPQGAVISVLQAPCGA